MRIGFFTAFAIFLLRMAVGWHFYQEGVEKLRDPDFTSAPFLQQAKGPLAEFYKSFAPEARIEDYLDLEARREKWTQFRHQAAEHYGFGREEEIKEQQNRLRELRRERDKMEQAGKQETEEYEALQGQIAVMERKVRKLENQERDADELYKLYHDRLTWLLTGNPENREEIEEFLLEKQRLEQAKEDPTTREVSFRRQWLEEKESELRSQAQEWIEQIDQLERDFQRAMLELATEEQRQRGEFHMPRDWTPPVDAMVTYLTVGVGVCLLLGLFTRLASVLGAIFLASVISTQPPWIASATPVHKELVEMTALFVLAGVAAGRYAGLDYFLHSFWSRRRGADRAEASHESHT